jgi:AbrB family looped-hinge helix DNA binding protein
MTTLTISNKGWVVIPAELRKKYHLLPGVEVRLVDYGGVLSIVPALADPIHQAAGITHSTKRLTEVLIAEHRLEYKHER